ncbi:hypothetical protein EI969_12255 [Pseudomonas sp. PB101]|nr:hypothetical protein [Pseudomonas sp. PB101]
MWCQRSGRHLSPVGASSLAMDANDNARHLNDCVAPKFFASKLAPTGVICSVGAGVPTRVDSNDDWSSPITHPSFRRRAGLPAR